MSDNPLSRRDFNKLSMAAFGGVMAGALPGCDDKSKPAGGGSGGQPAGGAQAAAHDPKLLMEEPHVCRGLNTCKGKGACKTAGNECKGKNDCAGQGACASVDKHACGGENACKGQGGCGEYPGQNACKAQGGCGVPMTHEGPWKKARAAFEAQMKAAGKEFGPAPAAAPAGGESSS